MQKPNFDMISNLPDYIIGHILSLLPTKDAVITCVLSKRWICLWTFITNLHFEDSSPSFSKFVSRVLFLVNASSIQSCSLSLSEVYDAHHVNHWISDIINKRVKEVSIYSKNRNYIWNYLWQCKSLEKLVQNMNDCKTVIVPSFVSLSSLTVLKLIRIAFHFDDPDSYYDTIRIAFHFDDPDSYYDTENPITLKFPLLREYETKNCIWSNVKRVTFDVPMLEVLFIEHYTNAFLFGESSQSIIKFCAPRLKEFAFSGVPVLGYTLQLS
uniref:F-box/LRR-repeat protein At4g13960 family n=1 Tax=Cajanus cajan TaxID=3821 RepID=A0A151RCW9_CAJCA|nr:Putative F-box/LRR-repeat protein At4g13960 family [Cajanus cajan]